MKRILPLLILSSATLFAQQSQPVVHSTWTITGDVGGYPINETCIFTQANDKLTGSCTNEQGKNYDTTGTMTGKKVVFVHGGEYQGEALTLTFTGAYTDKGELAGDIDVEPLDYQGTFTATKKAATT